MIMEHCKRKYGSSENITSMNNVKDLKAGLIKTINSVNYRQLRLAYEYFRALTGHIMTLGNKKHLQDAIGSLDLIRYVCGSLSPILGQLPKNFIHKCRCRIIKYNK